MSTQSKIGWRPYVNPSITASSLWNSIYSVYNADAIGSTSLNTSLFSAYNGESNTNDSKGTNNGTAVGGLTYTTGKIGNAFQFNGTNALVSLPVNNFNFTGDFSISCWFKTSTVSGNQMIFSNLMYNGGARKGYYIALLGNTVYVWLANTLSFQQNISTSSIISINTWYNIVVTRESGFVKLYVNNSLIVTDTNAITMEYVYTTPSIGAYTNGATTTWYFNGIVDALNVWQKALTQSEITELYNSSNGAQYVTDSFYKPTTSDALNTYNGTAQGGLTYGVGKVGTAFVFNGTNAHVSFPTGAFHSLTTDFSVSAWVSIPDGYYTQIPIFSNISSTSWFSNVGGFWLTLFGYGIQFRIGDKTVGPHDTTTTILTGNISPAPSNTFVHIVATRKAGQRSRIYYNGTLIANNTDARNPAYYTSGVNTTTPTIGNIKIPNGVQDAYYAPNGTKIDGLSVWSKELTQADVTELYNSGNGKQYPN